MSLMKPMDEKFPSSVSLASNPRRSFLINLFTLEAADEARSLKHRLTTPGS